MHTADIITKESDLEVSYGMFSFYGEPRDAAFTSLKYLYMDLTNIRSYYIKLGFHLDEFARCEYYRDFGFLTLEDFCSKNLALDKGSVSRCINVFREFNASNDVTVGAGFKTTGSAMELSERWKDYSYTQLCEMLPLTPGQRKEISPEMSVKQIREYKKRLKSFKSDSGPVASTQPEGFDYETYIQKKGAARNNYVKNSGGAPAVLHIFDSDGKEVVPVLEGCFLTEHEGHYFIRLDSIVEINII